MSNISKIRVGETTYDLKDLNAMTYADNGVLGAKNLLPSKATSKTINGVTFTVNADGSVTANGTATAEITLWLVGDGWNYSNCKDIPLSIEDNTEYIFGGETDDSSDVYMQLVIKNSDGTNSTYWVSYGIRKKGSTSVINRASQKWHCWIRINNGTTVTNKTFYPMLRLASDPDDTYVPYAMTNREITEELTVQESAVTDIVEGASITNNHNNLYKQGKFVHMLIELAHVTATAYDTIIAKVPSNYKPRTFAVDCNMSNIQIARIYVDNSGNVKSRNALSDASFVASATWITD